MCRRSKAISRIAILGFTRAYFSLFEDLFGGITWFRALEGKGAKESWLTFKHHFFQAQDQSTLTGRKSRKGARRPAWLNSKLLGKLKWKRRV